MESRDIMRVTLSGPGLERYPGMMTVLMLKVDIGNGINEPLNQ